MRTSKMLRFGSLLPMLLLFGSLLIHTPGLAQSDCGCDAATNLVPEGDFEIAGNMLPLAYSTSLNHLCACNYSPGNPGYGSYCIETDAYLKCTSFDHINDHTSGAGKFMVVDGFPDSDPPTGIDPNIVWKYGMTFAAAGDYEFSFWWYPNMSSSTGTLPEFDFRVDYSAVVSGIGGTSATLDSWNEFCTTFTIVDPGFHVIEIGQLNTGNGSNDYGIDDIFLGHCCSCDIQADFTYVQTSNFNVDFTSAVTSSSCTSPVWYEWDFGDGTSASGPTLSTVSHNYPGSGSYSVNLYVIGTDDAGIECTDKIKKKIIVEKLDVSCDVTAALNVLPSSNFLSIFNNSFDVMDIDHWTYQIYNPPITPGSYNSISGNVPSGTDASLHPDWNITYPTVGPGTYYICLWVYDLDVPPPFSCYDMICTKVEVPKDPDPICDVVASFNTNLLGGASYAFTNTSTASTALSHYWTVKQLPGGTIIHTANTFNLSYTFPGNGDYEVCLREIQPDGGGECFSDACEPITITDAENYLDFTMGYHCKEPEPTLYLTSLVTNAPFVDISTSCGGTAIPTPGGNAAGVPMPVTPPNYDVATQGPLEYSTCTVCVTDANGLVVCKTIYFNCHACPGSLFPEGTPPTPGIPGQGDYPGKQFGQQMVLFPNPVNTDEVQVRISGMYGPTELQLIDVSGKVVRQVTLDVNVSTVQLPVNVQDLPAGVYFFQVQSDEGTLFEKLIIE
ncbi:MAG: T9SS type A sorting domain-containing protein [Saprospiraceae bacterium]|nr:T9SS type A sorting domain-containing protein [Saprospiraceae bacterium]